MRNIRQWVDLLVADPSLVGRVYEVHPEVSFAEMREWGDDLGQFDLIVALTPASQRQALELTSNAHVDVEYWPIMDPTGLAEGREAQLAAYRATRDQIHDRMVGRFGPPSAPASSGAAA